MKNNFDVIVVGAGPAGVSAAISCINNGLNVVLVDSKKKDKIGDKVCGEAISKETSHTASDLLQVQYPQGEEINANVKELVLQTAIDEDHIALPAIGYMVDRHKYGQRLLQDALERGVKLLERTKVIRAIIIEKKVSGIVIKPLKKEEEELHSKLVIDCSGVRGIVRTTIDESLEPFLYNKLTKSDYASCYREIIELNKEHDLDGKIVLKYEKDIPSPGYIWFFADGKKRLNCGTGFIKEGKNKDKSVKSVYFNAMAKYYHPETYTVLDGRGGNVPIRPPLWNAVAPGLLVAGDAAFHADPLTAEGHGPALLAGYYAGQIAKKAIDRDEYSTQALWEYNRHVFSSFGSDNARSRILTITLEKLGAANLEFLLKRKVIKQADLTSEGILKKSSVFNLLNRAIRCLPKIGLLVLIKRTIDVSKAVAKLCDEYPETPDQFGEWVSKIESLYKKLN
ncbi:MAG: NAD(P)/FAD-dependent oxidoreductase [Candidatus Heimdallarchaeota archaeon]|nr:NAD(P)/FAD-dependent oxidoreductase [Candidatus Heimdallarchaeota archaeon]